MKRLMKKKVNLFGKSVPVFAIVLLSVALVSGALLSYYGVITGMAVVSQSVTVEDSPITGAWNTNLVAGKTIVDCDNDGLGHSVKNNAGVVAPIQFGTTCNNSIGYDDGTITNSSIDWATVGDNNKACDGIVTEIYGILKLTSKQNVEGKWIISDNEKVTIQYTIVGNTFEYEIINVTGSWDLTNYKLIYYKDIEGDKCPDNRAAGVITLAENIGNNNLPYADDFNNKGPANYCDNCYGDHYEHCVGAKLWLVPVSDINGDKLTWANMGSYLYETDLIMYSNDANNVMNLLANGGGFNFCVDNSFALNLVPDTYTLETQIVPVTA